MIYKEAVVASRDKQKDWLASNILRWAKKLKAIEYKGGSCPCGQTNPIMLNFHHLGEKYKSISALLSKRARLEDVLKEADKCDLLCENCHQEKHGLNTGSSIIKKLCLDVVRTDCAICGYNKCIAALEFHHIDPLTKKFKVGTRLHHSQWSNNKISTIEDIPPSLMKELKKCTVYCANCHSIYHDNGFFQAHKQEIYNKMATMVSNIHVDPVEIVALRKTGLTMMDIADKCGCSYPRVYQILRAHNIQGTRSIDYKKILDLKNSGLSRRDISIQVGCSKDGVRYALKHMGVLHGN